MTVLVVIGGSPLLGALGKRLLYLGNGPFKEYLKTTFETKLLFHIWKVFQKYRCLRSGCGSKVRCGGGLMVSL